ncbi:hypothetical protein B484DRAFT_188682, partial [Ochromonadaceae sp. CCMP2298]
PPRQIPPRSTWTRGKTSSATLGASTQARSTWRCWRATAHSWTPPTASAKRSTSGESGSCVRTLGTCTPPPYWRTPWWRSRGRQRWRRRARRWRRRPGGRRKESSRRRRKRSGRSPGGEAVQGGANKTLSSLRRSPSPSKSPPFPARTSWLPCPCLSELYYYA